MYRKRSVTDSIRPIPDWLWLEEGVSTCLELTGKPQLPRQPVTVTSLYVRYHTDICLISKSVPSIDIIDDTSAMCLLGNIDYICMASFLSCLPVFLWCIFHNYTYLVLIFWWHNILIQNINFCTHVCHPHFRWFTELSGLLWWPHGFDMFPHYWPFGRGHKSFHSEQVLRTFFFFFAVILSNLLNKRLIVCDLKRIHESKCNKIPHRKQFLACSSLWWMTRNMYPSHG